MLRSRVLVILIALFSAPSSVLAQGSLPEAAPLPELPLATESGPGVAMVQGLAVNDALNVRAEASPVGKVMGRLPNGATVNKHECKSVNGYDWCRVDAIEVKDAVGWAPARYLRMLDLGEGEADVIAAAPDTGANASPAASDAQETAVETPPAVPGQSPENGTADVAPPSVAVAQPVAPEATDPTSETAATGSVKDDRAAQPSTPASPPVSVEQPAEPVPLPPGLDARFAGAPAPAVSTPPLSAAEPFYMLALSDVATEEAATPQAEPASPESPAVQAQPEPPVAPEGDKLAVGPEGDKVAALAPATEPASAFEIPCARYVGQPMTRCRAESKRGAGGVVEVLVTWPDGGTRMLQFRDGTPAGTNGRGEFRYVREGGLNMIRVGVSERFEITEDQSSGS